jgi:glutamate-1-semialdehyde 2,1-aminomutase
VTLAKSIGGGLPLGAFGGTNEAMDAITEGRVLHLGTYNGNPLCMAAAKAVLSEVCTPDATAETIRRSESFADRCDAVIARHGLPAHTVRFGAKGCVTWSPEPIRNYREYKTTDFDLAYAQWIHHINNGLLLPPGLDDQWLVSVLHTDADIDRGVEVFEEFVAQLLA